MAKMILGRSKETKSKKKTSKNWGGYKQYTLTDGTKFLARDDSDAKLYREKVGDKS